MTSSEDPIWHLTNFNSNIYIFAPENGVSRVLVACQENSFSDSDKKKLEMYIYDELFLERKIKIKFDINCGI